MGKWFVYEGKKYHTDSGKEALECDLCGVQAAYFSNRSWYRYDRTLCNDCHNVKWGQFEGDWDAAYMLLMDLDEVGVKYDDDPAVMLKEKIDTILGRVRLSMRRLEYMRENWRGGLYEHSRQREWESRWLESHPRKETVIAKLKGEDDGGEQP